VILKSVKILPTFNSTIIILENNKKIHKLYNKKQDSQERMKNARNSKLNSKNCWLVMIFLRIIVLLHEGVVIIKYFIRAK